MTQAPAIDVQSASAHANKVSASFSEGILIVTSSRIYRSRRVTPHRKSRQALLLFADQPSLLNWLLWISSERCDLTTGLETLATLKSGNAPSQAIDILAHTVAVSHSWLSRATRTPRPSSMWPRWLLTTIEAQLDSCFAGWKRCLIAGHPGRSLDYVNSSGEPCGNTPEEVIVEIICPGL